MVYTKTTFKKFLKPSYLNYNFIEIILSLIISFCLILFSFIYVEKNKEFRKLLVDIIHPFSTIISLPIQKIDQAIDKLDYFFDIENENKRLTEKMKSYEDRLMEFYYFKIENDKLKRLLNLSTPPNSKKVSARIIIDPSSFISSTIFIDAGKKSDIRINNPVFNENGLIGRVISVSNNTSEILPITDPKSSLPVLSLDSETRFFVKGSSNGLNIEHLENPDILIDNELIVSTITSGYFKEGIIVGKVKRDNNTIKIIPTANKNDSIFVKVLIYDYEKEQPNFGE